MEAAAEKSRSATVSDLQALTNYNLYYTTSWWNLLSDLHVPHEQWVLDRHFWCFICLLFTGVRHLPHVLTVPPTKACLLCATPTGMDLYNNIYRSMPVGTYRVQSPGFPKIVYFQAHCSPSASLSKGSMHAWLIEHNNLRPTAGLCFKQTRLKGTEAKTEVGMKTQKICEYFHLHDSVCGSIQLIQVLFFSFLFFLLFFLMLRVWASQGAAIFVRSLQKKSRKWSALDVCSIFRFCS